MLLPILMHGAAYADVYKCTVEGGVIFTDQPCDGSRIKLQSTNTLQSVDVGKYSSSTWYVDFAGYKTALRVSEAAGVPLFIYFQADWCRYCRQLERELLDTPEGKRVLRKVVKVRITPENGEQEDRLFDKVGGTGYPSVFIKKSTQSIPKQYSMKSKESGSWAIGSPSFLEQLIDSQF